MCCRAASSSAWRWPGRSRRGRPFLLMDEPFSGLDSRLKDSVRAETLAILRESRATAIVVTHDAEEAMRMGDRIALLATGGWCRPARRRNSISSRPTCSSPVSFRNSTCSRRGSGMAAPIRRSGRWQTPGLADGSIATVAVRMAGFDVSETAGEIEARIRFAALSRRRRTDRVCRFWGRQAGARADPVRRFVRRRA